MHEFRPADLIEQDTKLAVSLADGDLDALDVVIERYGRAVHAVVIDSREFDAVDVFTDVWNRRHEFEAGSGLAPWVGAIAAQHAPDLDAEAVSMRWSLAMAIEKVDEDIRESLRSHHVDGQPCADDVARHELRLRRRLVPLGDNDAVSEALGESAVWVDPPAGLAAGVRSEVQPPVSDAAQPIEAAWAEAESPSPPMGRVARSLRPLLIGLAGAVLVLFVTIVALSAAGGSADPVVLTGELVPTGAIVGVEAGTLTVTAGDSGLAFDMNAPTLPRRAGDQFYEAVLLLRDGTELSTGSFNEGASVDLSAGVPLENVEAFRVVARTVGSDRLDVVLTLDIPRS